jgi:hypothetical protein
MWSVIPNNNDDYLTQQKSINSSDIVAIEQYDADTTAQDVVTTCMNALLQNDKPRNNAGLEVCFDYSSDRCRAALGGSLEEFILYASNPTFGSMTNAIEYTIVNVGTITPATVTRGAMQTVVAVAPGATRVTTDERKVSESYREGKEQRDSIRKRKR